MVGWLVGWFGLVWFGLVGWLVGWFIGWSVSQSVGWLVGQLGIMNSVACSCFGL